MDFTISQKTKERLEKAGLSRNPIDDIGQPFQLTGEFGGLPIIAGVIKSITLNRDGSIDMMTKINSHLNIFTFGKNDSHWRISSPKIKGEKTEPIRGVLIVKGASKVNSEPVVE